jgi:hypothetical protein
VQSSCVRRSKSIWVETVKIRRKTNTAFEDFRREIHRLRSLDEENQRRVAVRMGRPAAGQLGRRQLELLTEGIFLQGFRAYEAFIQEVFILYCMRKTSRGGKIANSYLKAKGYEHTYKMIKSSMEYLDWASPEHVIRRAELYLEDGFVVKAVYVARRQMLQDFKTLRNHIAHNSFESAAAYSRLVQRLLRTRPVRLPTAGGFLLMAGPGRAGSYYLADFLDEFEQVADDLTQ